MTRADVTTLDTVRGLLTGHFRIEGGIKLKHANFRLDRKVEAPPKMDIEPRIPRVNISWWTSHENHHQPRFFWPRSIQWLASFFPLAKSGGHRSLPGPILVQQPEEIGKTEVILHWKKNISYIYMHIYAWHIIKTCTVYTYDIRVSLTHLIFVRHLIISDIAMCLVELLICDD